MWLKRKRHRGRGRFELVQECHDTRYQYENASEVHEATAGPYVASHIMLAIPHGIGVVELVVGLWAIESSGVEGEDILQGRVATGKTGAAAPTRTLSDMECGTEVDAVFCARVNSM